MEDGKRSFTVVEIRKPGQKNKSGSTKKTTGEGGRYLSKSPRAAASKAFNASCRSKSIKGQCTLEVTLKETTRNGDEKIYKYVCKRIKLAEPRIVQFGKNTVKIEYDTRIVSLN